MTNRFIIDDAGTLIDMQTRDTFDYVSDVCGLLNEQHETIQRLKQNIDELLSVDIEEELLKENEQLQQRNKRLEKKIQRERTSFTKTHKRWSKEAETKIKELSEENEHIKQTIQDMIKTERTELGQSVLRQLGEAIQ